jgi:DNA-binding NarL/FixJ family response regulator
MNGPSQKTRRPRVSRSIVVVVDDGAAWPAELLDAVDQAGYLSVHVSTLSSAISVIERSNAVAVLIDGRHLGLVDTVVLRQCRERFPNAAVIVVTTGEVRPELMRAFESGATSFIAWPASCVVVRQALDAAAHANAATSKVPPGVLAETRANAPTQGDNAMANPQPPAGKPGGANPPPATNPAQKPANPAPQPSTAKPANPVPAPQQKPNPMPQGAPTKK